jgi:predicted pyridoxine 5'-phosphate oxidase superfamily flavin-nucleotide-binding protein
VSPKELWWPYDEGSLVLGDVGSPVTVRNLRENDRICLGFVEVARQSGWKIDGRARVVAPDEPDFARLGATLIELADPALPVRHVLHVVVERATRFVAPSYRLQPELAAEQRTCPAAGRRDPRPGEGAGPG